MPKTSDAEKSVSRTLAIVGVVVPTLLILFVMSGAIQSVRALTQFPFVDINWRFPQLFVDNTPTGGDMGAHVLLPQFLRDTLLPSGRLIGWSNDWYAGFPILYFYFPLPALATVALDVILSYGVAFKLVTVAGLVAMPAALYFLVRSLGFQRVVAAIAGLTGSMYVFMESFSIFGGNIKSTLAGEFSFSWALTLSLIYLGIVVRDSRRGRGFSLSAGVVLALCALSHLVPAVVVVLASLPVLVRRRGWLTIGGSWALGFALAAFWALPLLIRGRDLTTDMGWNPVSGLIGNTSNPGITATPIPDDFVPILVLGLIGLVWTLLRRDEIAVLLAMTVLPLAGYFLLPKLGLTKLYNARLLPHWYVGMFIFAGLAIGLAVTRLARFMPQRSQALAIAGSLSMLVVLSTAAVAIHDVPGWVSWNFEGYEGKKESYGELDGLMQTINELPDGRVMWEANSDELNRYGTPMALMLIPYWAEGHPSMEGVYFESSLTTPFHFLNAAEVSRHPSNPVRWLRYGSLNFDRALPHLALYDVKYYISMTDEATSLAAADPRLDVIAESEPWTIFRLPDSSLVEVASNSPSVYMGSKSFTDASVEWYEFTDPEELSTWLVADGPVHWPRVEEVVDRLALSSPYDVADAVVSDVKIDDHRISFTTTAVGVPHLVKVSYFPNWTATDAEGPFRAAPSLMVVIPTGENVVLEFVNTPAENVGNALTAGGILILVGVGWRRRRQGREVAA